MIDALVSGHVFGQPTHRVGKSGKPFVTAKVRAPMRNNEGAFVNVVTFSDHVMAGLLALGQGAAVAIAGELTTDVWTDREGKPHAGLHLVAHELLTEHHVNRRRSADSRFSRVTLGAAVPGALRPPRFASTRQLQAARLVPSPHLGGSSGRGFSPPRMPRRRDSVGSPNFRHTKNKRCPAAVASGACWSALSPSGGIAGNCVTRPFPELPCGRTIAAMSEVLPDACKRQTLARERLRRYRSGKRRIDFYPDEDSAAVIAALVSPHDNASAVINWLIAEAIADRPDADGRDVHSAGPLRAAGPDPSRAAINRKNHNPKP